MRKSRGGETPGLDAPSGTSGPARSLGLHGEMIVGAAGHDLGADVTPHTSSRIGRVATEFTNRMRLLSVFPEWHHLPISWASVRFAVLFAKA